MGPAHDMQGSFTVTVLTPAGVKLLPAGRAQNQANTQRNETSQNATPCLSDGPGGHDGPRKQQRPEALSCPGPSDLRVMWIARGQAQS